jgi:hypothetical protein
MAFAKSRQLFSQPNSPTTDIPHFRQLEASEEFDEDPGVLTPAGLPPPELFVLSLWTGWTVTLAAGELWIRYTRGAGDRLTWRSGAVGGPDGTPVTVDGKAVTIWRREKDGSWKCVVDIWNDAPPAPR